MAFSIEVQALLDTFKSQQAALTAAVLGAFEPCTAYDKKTGPLTVPLDLRGGRGKLQLEVWVKSSGPAVFNLEGSRNGVDWRLMDTLSLDGAGGEIHGGYMNAYPVVRVSTTAAGDNEIEIVAAR